MRFLRGFGAAVVIVLCGTVTWSDTVRVETGGDFFTAGAVIDETLNTSGDAFASARTATVRGEAQGDLHVTGFDVTSNANTSEDLYAFGATVVVRGKTAEDLTAAGYSVRTEAASQTSGNARLFGNTVVIEGPVAGALTATGRDVVLNASVRGDARIVARSISFGPEAVIAGTLTYRSKEKINVPERVAAADRVIFEKATATDAWDEWDKMRKEMPVLPTLATMLFGFIVSLLFFVVLGAVMLGFMPRRLEKMRQSIARAPGQSMLLGVIGLSMLFGMVPIVGLTIVGLPFVPIVVLAIIVAWTLGYALGAYSVAMRVWVGFGNDAEPGNITRLLVFAGALIVVAMLNFIPFVGWVANYTLVLLGLGAMTNAVLQYLIGNPGEAFDIDMQPIEN
ncbi:hypothetical protein KX928_00690 [Roseobacter sp. YSTF-M11]|uniref:DUF8173 domain-containing protein n=1 Tax=Roseobacter insulae TaxID=2859783 RepID=A0A9X1FR72_9RHOB|nr:hypothetical protein [Roseobacter insulae]MBW4706296.1 hypothetical protein [Roseobacter insulae]